jgi:hypothetical protein
MNEISRIQSALRPHLPWHGARLTFLALFLVALFRVESVNLDKLSSVFANRAQSASSYKRLTRFFRGFAVDFDAIARAVAGWVYVVATRLDDGGLLILATNHCPKTALADYRLRWGIETLFAALKTRGFNLESTHFCHAERLSKLIALLALAFCWAMLTRLWHHQRHPLSLKAHGRRAKSLFRSGCDFL